ncbi:MAG TPA: hypothetical protein VFT66_10945 [Roseiflexaceae bacterium]|nr:hypothetical protein [Roseiflexaceae bacterium]
MNRPKTYTIAAILQFLLSAMNGVGSIPFLMRGNVTNSAPPFFVELVLFATAILGFIGTYGIWRNQRWGVILTIILCILTGLVNLPGLLFAPGVLGKVATAASLIPAIVIIVLLLWPKPKLTPVSNNVS